MNRWLQWFNTLGVAALAGLCLLQWQANRRVNLEAAALERVRLDQVAKLAEQAQALAGCTADLNGFREQLSRTVAGLQDAQQRLAQAERDYRQLEAETEQLRVSVTNWADAVAVRDERLQEVGRQLLKLAEERNETVARFNELAGRFNTVVDELNQWRAKAAGTPAAAAKDAPSSSR